MRADGRAISRKELTNAYRDIRRKLGKQPASSDVDVYGKYSHRYYIREFGSWKKFLATIDLIPLTEHAKKHITRKELVAAFRELERKLGSQPSVTDIEKKGRIHLRYYQKEYGGWSHFLNSLGRKPLIDFHVRRKDLDADYDKVKKKLGRIPTQNDIQKYARYSLSQFEKYSGYSRYKQSRGDGKKVVTRDDLIADFRKVKKKLRKIPTIKEWHIHGSYKSGYDLILEYFGGYRNFLNDQHEISSPQEKHRKYIRELIKEYFRIKKKLKRNPTGREFQERGKYSIGPIIAEFGSWGKFVLSLGEKPYERGGSWQNIPRRKQKRT
jgi:hypothetical protein